MEGSKGSVRLFGKVIHVDVGEDCAHHHAVEEDQKIKSLIKDGDQESTDSEGISRSTVITENYKPLAQNKRDPPARARSSDPEEERDDASNSQENGLRKPEKVLPCARCDSRDTKFCYYNNYNVNQPRYFCRNCQRYWTAGGSMRDVPIGAGRRKNKSYAVHRYQQVAIPAAQNVEQMNGSNVLCFGHGKGEADGYASKMPSTGRQWMSPGVHESRYTLNSHWSCVVPGAWNMPWLSPTVSRLDSPLGKRSRGGNAVNHC